jgi:hypothetical protein
MSVSFRAVWRNFHVSQLRDEVVSVIILVGVASDSVTEQWL